MIEESDAVFTAKKREAIMNERGMMIPSYSTLISTQFKCILKI